MTTIANTDKGKFLGKGTALAGPTAKMLGGNQPGAGATTASFATSNAGSFKPGTTDHRGASSGGNSQSFGGALAPVETTGFGVTQKKKSWMNTIKPAPVVGFGVGDKMAVQLPKAQCVKCGGSPDNSPTQAVIAQNNINKSYVQGISVPPLAKQPNAPVAHGMTSPVTPTPGQQTSSGVFKGNVSQTAQAVQQATSKLGNAQVHKDKKQSNQV